MVQTFPYPKNTAPEGFFFSNVNDVIGKRAKLPLQAGIALTAGYLSDTAVGSFLSSQIPAGYVAISIPVDTLSEFSMALNPGDHVSVLVALDMIDLDQNFQSALPNAVGSVTGICLNADGSIHFDATTGLPAATCPKTLTIAPSIGRTELEPTINQPVYVVPNGGAQRPRIVSQILISDATVLGLGDLKEIAKSAGTQPTPTPVPANAPTPAATAAPVTAIDPNNIITLIVSPQDAVTLNYILLNKGAKLNLVLRSAQDNKQTKTESVTLQFLMDQYNIPLPSKLPYGLEPAQPIAEPLQVATPVK
jgi:pilus assembly protein CpaB